MKKIQPSLAPGIAWFVISTILLSLPGSAFPHENWLDRIWFDKWVHIGLFGVLVFLLGWGLLKKTQQFEILKKRLTGIVLISLAYGIIMEFVQNNFIPNRSFDYGDIIADFVGCLIGWWLAIKYTMAYIKK